MTSRVVGLDLSLSSTGVASPAGLERLKPPRGMVGCPRIQWITRAATSYAADLYVIEGPAYSRQLGAGHHEAAGLWWAVRAELWQRDIPVAIVTPGGLKKYATGRGTASKDQVLAAVIRRYAHMPISGNDEADAYVLQAMGLDYLGHAPLPVPQSHRVALDGATWPENLPLPLEATS
jgi:crossover junction endodeoxyribonuclease RuvC